MTQHGSVLVPSAESGPWAAARRCADFLVRRRIHVSLAVFTALVAEDVATGVKPHNLANLTEHHAAWGLVLVTAGLAVRSWAAGTLRKWASLTTDGAYAVVRHPLYVGSFLMMIGFCAIIDDGENIWFVAGPLLAIYVLAVLKEERRLAARFGNDWADYARRVPRFIPRSVPARPLAAWSARQWLANREYRAVLASLAGLAALQVWRQL